MGTRLPPFGKPSLRVPSHRDKSVHASPSFRFAARGATLLSPPRNSVSIEVVGGPPLEEAGAETVEVRVGRGSESRDDLIGHGIFPPGDRIILCIEHSQDSKQKPAFRDEGGAESGAVEAEALADALRSLPLADRRALASWLTSTATASAPASSPSGR
jgi:hypothetical protein